MNSQLTHDLLIDRAQVDGQAAGRKAFLRSSRVGIVTVPPEYVGHSAAQAWAAAFKAGFVAEGEELHRKALRKTVCNLNGYGI